MLKKLFGLIVVLAIFSPLALQAAVLPANFPRLANYFLKWEISDEEVPKLAKWNLLVLDMETQETSRDKILRIRELNPKIIILVYITSQEILDKVDYYNQAYLRQEFNKGISSAWWLRDMSGNKISNWPNTSMFNLSDGAPVDETGQRFIDYLPEFIVARLKSSGLWDGVFYDNTWNSVSWVSPQSLDLNNDGVPESSSEVDRLWAAGFKKMLAKTRALAGQDFVIVGNGQIYEGFQPLLNGMMLENFPAPWENGGTWAGSMETYLELSRLNLNPQLPIINVYDKNQNNFRHFRYGLVSTLLGDGFYSYDYDVTNHGQTWWYDEYEVNLGAAQSALYNLLDNSATKLQAGLWRRDFKNGIALVNSTSQKKTYVFQREEFEKINGQQDSLFNNGQKINYIQLESRDAVVLLKKASVVINQASFTNGYFFRVFNGQGETVSNGFFSYLSMFPGSSEVFVSNFEGESNFSLGASLGQLSLFSNGRQMMNLKPYGVAYKKSLSFAASLKDNALEKIAVGAGLGGGPQVQLFSAGGKLESSFFAYDKNRRGGVNVALGDIDGDGALEIVTGPGQGDEPVVKTFSLQGKLKTSFLAYDKNMRGGVNVALGDIDGDGALEIVTGPASAGGPQIRIFSARGKNLRNFFAYDQKFHGGIRVSASDINNDGQAEILVGLKNFY
ncbi:MAG: putative glycoside hydrolase [Patescibacteria group bacterium]